MTVHALLLALMGECQTLTGLVVDRYYHIKAPQQVTSPYIVFRDAGSVPEEHLGGSAGQAKARFEFNIYSEDAGLLPSIGDALREALQARSKGDIQSIHAADALEGYDEEVELPFASVDFIVLYRQQQYIGA